MEVIKGRMYDYNNGRFLSVDPFIQSPTSTQSMNPYTYIFNNPLSGTDPTGYRVNCVLKCADGGDYGNGSRFYTPREYRIDSGIDDGDGLIGLIENFDISRIDYNFSSTSPRRQKLQKKLKNKQIIERGPLSSPVPITVPDERGNLRTLTLMSDGYWHTASGHNGYNSYDTQFGIDSEGVAHATPEVGLPDLGFDAIEYGSYFAGGAGALKGGYSLIKGASSNVLYRVQGGVIPNASKTRIVVGDSGEISIQGSDMLFVNLGQKQRALDFLAKRGDQASLVQLRVSTGFANKLRSTAVEQRLGRSHPGLPQKVDPTKAIDQFGIPSNMFDELIQNVKR